MANNTYPYGIRLGMNFNYMDSGFDDDYGDDYFQFTSYELAQIAPQDCQSWIKAHVPFDRQKQPAVQLTLEEVAPSLVIVGNVIHSSIIAVLSSFDVIRIDIGTGFQAFEFTNNPTPPFPTLDEFIAEFEALLAAVGWDEYLQPFFSDAGYLCLMIKKVAEDGVLGSKLEVDSVANGSTFNSLAGYNPAGTTGVVSVSPDDQLGFVLQNIAFEIGHIGGLRRLPAAQTR